MDSISLYELCSEIGATLSERFDKTVWVRAEVASLSQKNGHCYMELVEKNVENNSMLAKIKANCWASVWRLISPYFESATGHPMSVGMQVLLEVSVSFHSTFGMALTVHDVDPQFTLGDLAKQRQQTIARLEEGGMMDMQKSLVLPTLVKRIAVVSSADAAGYQDFVHTLSPATDVHALASGVNPICSAAGYAYQLQLFPATMQGENAPRSIMHALDRVYEGKWDVVVITRGGGATTDLGCFDDYALCEYAAQFPIPVLSAVGHTKDVSVLDMVSYEAVKTPTFAAEWLLERTEKQAGRIDEMLRRLQQTASRQLALRQERVRYVETVIRMRLQQAAEREQQKLQMMDKTIALHSPETIFRKGYSLTLKDGKPVRSAADVAPGDELTTMLADGSITSTAK